MLRVPMKLDLGFFKNIVGTHQFYIAGLEFMKNFLYILFTLASRGTQ